MLVLTAGHEDDREREAEIGKPARQIQPRAVAQIDIDDEACRIERRDGAHERLARSKQLHAIAEHRQQPCQRLSEARIVVDHSDDVRPLRLSAYVSLQGRSKGRIGPRGINVPLRLVSTLADFA